MTISSQNRVAGPYTGNGVTTSFPFSFKVFSAGDVVAVLTDSAGNESVLDVGSRTVSINANQDAQPGGAVVLPSPLPPGSKLTITSDVAALQLTELTNQGGFYPKVINNALDKLTVLIQQAFGGLGRSLKFPISDTSYNATLPSKDQRRGRLLAFDPSTGSPAQGPLIASVDTVSGNLANIDTVAGQISDVQTCAENIDAILDAPTQAQAAHDIAEQIGDIDAALNAAAGNAAAAAVSAGSAATANTSAQAAKTAAELARDAAFVNANVYDTTEAGLVATTNGQQFQVAGTNGMLRYKNNAGSAVLIAQYPKAPTYGGYCLVMSGKIAHVSTVDAGYPNANVTFSVATGTRVLSPFGEITLQAGTFVLNANVRTSQVVLSVTSSGQLNLAPNIPPGNSGIGTLKYSGWSYINMFLFSESDGYAVGYPTETTFFNVKRFGAGNGEIDDAAISAAVYAAQLNWWSHEAGKSPYGSHRKDTPFLYFPEGNYKVSSFSLFKGIGIKGDGSNSVIEGVDASGTPSLRDLNIYDRPSKFIKDITLRRLAIRQQNISGHSWAGSSEIDSVIFESEIGNSSAYVMQCYGSNTVYKINNCRFNWPACYIYIYSPSVAGVDIKRNHFTGTASHAIRGDGARGASVRHNRLIGTGVGWKTGIFFGSDRAPPIEGVEIHKNLVENFYEEGISLDGFGNNANLCPVIGNGPIAAATNDASGRLVITAKLKYHNGSTPNVDSPLSIRSDWKSFYWSFNHGSGLDGLITRIVDFNPSDGSVDGVVWGTLTLDCRESAASVVIGGRGGVQGGFFNCSVTNNILKGARGASDVNYSVGLSIYLNVFNTMISGNRLIDCSKGIQLTGGTMLSTYDCLAFNNKVVDNFFIGCKDKAAWFVSSYTSTLKQVGNEFRGNTVIGGQLSFNYQSNFVFDGNNILGDVQTTFFKCGNSLPTPSASHVGKSFMRITDGANGYPTDISYYVCKLVSGSYSWVEI